MQEIYLEQLFDAPRSRVFAELSDHEKLNEIFGLPVERIRNGNDGSPNGLGSVRRLKPGPGAAFEETVTAFTPDTMIEYRITQGSPLKNHVGTMEFSDEGNGTRLRYRIVFEAKYPIPLLGQLVKLAVGGNIRRGLKKMAARLR